MSLLRKNTETTEHTCVERLSAYLDDELSPQEKAVVECHLSDCTSCQCDLQTLRQTVQWVREMPTVPLPCSFTIPVPARKQAARWKWRVPVLQGATALVAAMLLVVVAGDFLLTGGLVRTASPSDAVMKEVALEAQPTESAVALMMAPADEPAPAEPQAAAEVESVMVAETVVVEEAEVEVEAPNAKMVGEAPPPSAPEDRTQTPPPEFGTMSAAEVVTSTGGGAGPEEGDVETPVAARAAMTEPVAAQVLPEGEADVAAVPLPTGPVTTLADAAPEPTAMALAAAPGEEMAVSPDGREAESGQRAGSEQLPLAFWLDAAKVGLSVFLALLLAATLVLMALRRRAA